MLVVEREVPEIEVVDLVAGGGFDHRPLGCEPKDRRKRPRSERIEKQRLTQLSNLLSGALVIGSKYAKKRPRSERIEKQRLTQLSNLLSGALVIGSKYAKGSRDIPRDSEEHGKKTVN
jgi:hypothetical protein